MATILLVINFTGIAYADDPEQKIQLFVFIEAKIYRLNDKTDDQDLESQIKNAVLEHTPALMTIAGQKATIEVGIESLTGKPEEMLTLHILPNDDATKFDLDFQVQEGENKSISHIDGAAIDNVLTLSATLNNVTRLITVKATKLSEEDTEKFKAGKYK